MLFGAARTPAFAARRSIFLVTSTPARHRCVAHCEVPVARNSSGGSGGGGVTSSMPKTSILWFRKVRCAVCPAVVGLQ